MLEPYCFEKKNQIRFWLIKFFFFINVDVQVSLGAPQLISRTLKLTIIILATTRFELEITGEQTI
jgi:hypothetical protein